MIGALGHAVLGPYGRIDQTILGRAIAKEIALHERATGEVIYVNAAMTALAAE